MAGNIIPAIATTNAVIAGVIVMQALHVLSGQEDKCKTVSFKVFHMQYLLIPLHPRWDNSPSSPVGQFPFVPGGTITLRPRWDIRPVTGFRNKWFLLGGIGSPTRNSQPGGPGLSFVWHLSPRPARHGWTLQRQSLNQYSSQGSQTHAKYFLSERF